MNIIARTTRWAARQALRAAGLDVAWRMRRGMSGWLGGAAADCGPVTPRMILSIAAARRCIDAIASDLAAMPLSLVQERDDESDREAKEHPAYGLFKRSPDGGDSTPVRWRQAIVAHAVGVGNGYGQIAWSANWRKVNLYLLDPLTTSPVEVGGRIEYQVAGAARPLPRDEVLHVAGLGWDGIKGYSPAELHPMAFGLTLSAERHGYAFLEEGATLGGFLKSQMELTAEAKEELISSFQARHRGSRKAGGWGLLPPGVEAQVASVDPEKAQLNETRKAQTLEMCRIFDVPPDRVGEYSEMHYSTVEATNRSYIQRTLLFWARAFEESLNLRLLTPEEQAAGYTFKHDFTSMLRGDAAARTAMFSAMNDRGVISGNQWAIEEGFPTYEGGEVHRVQLNTGAATGEKADPPADPEKQTDQPAEGQQP